MSSPSRTTRPARSEREALCASLLQAGPDAPTLCGTWTTADLAAHLVVRERRPDLAAGILVPALSARTDRAMARLVGDHAFADLVDLVRTGPPGWHPARVSAVDELSNLVEMFIHHEDVRRAGTVEPPRRLDADLTDALEHRLRTMARLLLRRVHGVAVQVVTPRRRTHFGPGGRPVVEIHGHPGEVLLFLTGRQPVAEVELVGDEPHVRTLYEARLGL